MFNVEFITHMITIHNSVDFHIAHMNQRSSLVLYTGFSDEQMQAIECSPYFIFFELIGLLFLFQFFYILIGPFVCFRGFE